MSAVLKQEDETRNKLIAQLDADKAANAALKEQILTMSHDLERSVQTSNEHRDQLESKIEILQNNLNKSAVKELALQRNVEAIKIQLDDTTSELSLWKVKHSSAIDEIKIVQLESSKQKSDAATYHKQLDEMRAQLADALKNAKSAIAESERLNSDLVLAGNKLNDVLQAKSKLENSLNAVISDKEQCALNLLKANNDVSKATAERDEARDELLSARMDVARAISAKEQAFSDAARNEVDVSRLNSEVIRLTVDVSQYKAQVADKEKQIELLQSSKSLEDQTKQLMDENEILKKKVAELQRELRELALYLNTLKGRYEEEKARADLAEQLAASLEDAFNAVPDSGDLPDESSSLDQVLDAASPAIAGVRHDAYIEGSGAIITLP